ncbi:MAG: glycosyltransferase [Planctomycetes bacterium]|nr:glycosyltransferase [Planctomycetota bacterium]
MRWLYLVNRYPTPSHAFIRREIRSLEALGEEVLRVSIQPSDPDLPDPDDQEEAQRTCSLLEDGAPRLVAALLLTALTRPARFLSALLYALRLGVNSDRGLLLHAAYLAEACALVKIAAREEIDHIHAHFGTNPPLVCALAKRLGGPGFSFTVHGPEEFDRPIALRLREKIRAARFTVAISSFGRGQLWRWCDNADRGSIEIVRCGVDEAFLDEEPSPITSEARLVFVGRLCPQKAPWVLMQAAEQLQKEGVPFQLEVLGDGELERETRSFAREHGLEGHVNFHGRVGAREVREALEGARALVLPSFAEGLPVVLMESLARGRPVITTSIAGIPELVRDGEEGWVVPSGDPIALAAAMKAALGLSPTELAEMGASGRERVRSQHDSLTEAERLAACARRSIADEQGA